MDIFDDMKDRLGCEFISDLPYIRTAVKKELESLPPDTYSKEQMERFYEYVFGK